MFRPPLDSSTSRSRAGALLCVQGPAHTLHRVWEYRLVDYDPGAGLSEQEWARQVAADGWVMWAGHGAWVEVNGRRVKRWDLRRPLRDRQPDHEADHGEEHQDGHE